MMIDNSKYLIHITARKTMLMGLVIGVLLLAFCYNDVESLPEGVCEAELWLARSPLLMDNGLLGWLMRGLTLRGIIWCNTVF